MSSASATPLLSRTRLVASVTALALAGAGLVGPMASSARAQEVVVEDVTIVPSQSAVATGFVTLTVQLALTSDEPLPSSIIATFGNDATVLAKPTDGRDARLGPEWLPTRIAWGELTLTSGTATDGVCKLLVCHIYHKEYEFVFSNKYGILLFSNIFFHIHDH